MPHDPQCILSELVGALGSVTMRDYSFTPESDLAMMREAVPGYDQMEDETVAATGAGAESVLELGIGTGETARRVLARHPEAKLIGIDGSPGMVAIARDTLPAHRVSVLVGALEDPLPEGPFDLVVSALAVPHLQADSKADLFRRIAGRARTRWALRPRRRRNAGRPFVRRHGDRSGGRLPEHARRAVGLA